MPLSTLKSNGRFDSLEKEIEISFSNKQLFVVYIIFFILSIYMGYKYSDDSFTPLQKLNFTRDPYSPILSTSILTIDNETLTFFVEIEYLYDVTKDNIKRGLNAIITNEAFTLKTNSKDSLNFFEKDLETNETKPYDWDVIQDNQEYKQYFKKKDEESGKPASIDNDPWKKRFDTRNSLQKDEKDNRDFFNDNKKEEKLLLLKNKKKKRVTFTFECTCPFYGNVTAWINFYNKQISANYSFILKRPQVKSSVIKCFNGSNGTKICHMHNVCINDNKVELFIPNKNLKVNQLLIPSLTFSYKNEKLFNNDKMSLNTYKLALLTEKSNLFDSLMDCFSQFTLDSNKKTLLMDYTNLIHRLHMRSFIPFATIIDDDEPLYVDTLIYDDNRIDPNIILNKITKSEKKEGEICIYQSTKQIVKDYDLFSDTILDQCPRCEIIEINKTGSIEKLYHQCKQASFLVGPLADEMIGARFWNTTVVAISPKHYKCNSWLKTASLYGAKIAHIIPKGLEVCARFFCDDCIKFNPKYDFDNKLLADGLELFIDKNYNSSYIAIDFTNNTIRTS